jgi:MFS family permease
MLTASAGLGFYGLSVYLSTLTRVKGFSVSGMSGATAVFFIVSGASGLGVARLLRSMDPRPIVVAGAVVAALALYLLGRVTVLWHVYAVYVLFAIGYAANALVISTTVVARWFHERRAVALSVASTGLSVGGVVLTPFARTWLKDLAITTATNRIALVYLAVVVPAALVLIRPDPSAYGLGVDGRASNHSGGEAGEVTVGAVGVAYAAAIRSRLFVALTAAFMLALGAQVGAIAQLVKLSDERITNASAAGRTVSILAACSVAGRLLGGLVVTRVGIERFTAAIFASQAVSIAFLAFARGSVAIYLGVVGFGLAIGNVLLLHPLLLANRFGTADYPRIYGRSQFLTMVGVAGGPFLFGWLRDHAGGYRTSYLVGAALATVALVVFHLGVTTDAATVDPAGRLVTT